jgi:hypothetical protein
MGEIIASKLVKWKRIDFLNRQSRQVRHGIKKSPGIPWRHFNPLGVLSGLAVKLSLEKT